MNITFTQEFVTLQATFRRHHRWMDASLLVLVYAYLVMGAAWYAPLEPADYAVMLNILATVGVVGLWWNTARENDAGRYRSYVFEAHWCLNLTHAKFRRELGLAALIRAFALVPMLCGVGLLLGGYDLSPQNFVDGPMWFVVVFCILRALHAGTSVDRWHAALGARG